MELSRSVNARTDNATALKSALMGRKHYQVNYFMNEYARYEK
jgi:hypothetical protein